MAADIASWEEDILDACLKERSADAVLVFRKLVSMPFCRLHGPEHHILVGSALLTAYKNAGGNIDLHKALLEIRDRAKKVPGGACGLWGACGAGISAGMFVSVATGSTPFANKEWGLSNLMTSAALKAIGEVGGPRCCKRDSYLAITEAVRFANQNLGVKMGFSEIKCTHSVQNSQCIGDRCPFR